MQAFLAEMSGRVESDTTLLQLCIRSRKNLSASKERI